MSACRHASTNYDQHLLLQQILQQTTTLEQTLSSLTLSNLALQKEAVKLSHLQQCYFSPQHQQLLEKVVLNQQQLSLVRQNYDQAMQKQKTSEEQVAQTKINNERLSNRAAELKYNIKKAEEEKELQEKEEKIELLWLNGVEEKRKEKEKKLQQQTANHHQLEVLEALKQLAEKAKKQDCTLSPEGSFHFILYQQLQAMTNDILEIKKTELELAKRNVLLSELKKSHDVLQKKFNFSQIQHSSFAQEKEERDGNQELNRDTLLEQKKHLEDDVVNITAQIQWEQRTTKEINSNIVHLALQESAKKTAHYIHPRRANIKKKRNAIEQMLQIIQRYGKETDSERQLLERELNELIGEEQYLTKHLLLP